MKRKEIIEQALVKIGIPQPYLQLKNYRFSSNNCNCNKGELPAKINDITVLVDDVLNGKITLNKPINLNGKETYTLDSFVYKVTCMICNQYVKF